LAYDQVRKSDYLAWPERAVEYNPRLEGPYPSLRTPFLEKRGPRSDEVGYRYFQKREEEEVGLAKDTSGPLIRLLDKNLFTRRYQARKELVREKIREAVKRISR